MTDEELLNQTPDPNDDTGNPDSDEPIVDPEPPVNEPDEPIVDPEPIIPVSVEDSILLTIKKLVGDSINGDEFNRDLIVAINSAIGILTQIGVGDKNFRIKDEKDTWTDYLGDCDHLEMVKDYIHLKVGLIFDPPQSSVITETKKALLNELEWRINVTVENLRKEDNQNEKIINQYV